MKKKILAIPLAILGMSFIAIEQAPILEKSFEVSNSAKRGFLESVEINKEKGTIDMLYSLPTATTTKRESFLNILTANSSGKLKFEVYSYDKDLNPIGTSREEERVYLNRWHDYSYTTVTPTFKFSCFCLSFKQVETTATYNWFTGYKKTTKDLENVKAETEAGGNYSFTGISYDLFADKSILVVAGKKIKKVTWNEFMHYDILSVDKDVNIKVADSINFQYGNYVIYSAPLKDQKTETNDELARDWILVFAPFDGSKVKVTKPLGDPKSTNLTYVRISPKGKVLEKFSFDSPANAWNIEGSYEQNGSVYLYGSAITKEPAKNYYSEVMSKGWDNLAYTNYQISKITKGKLDFISSPTFVDLQSKQSKPGNQKKLLELDGKECATRGITFLNSGEIFISYQDYEIKGAGANQQSATYKKPTNVFLFQFDATGTFKRSFGVEPTDEKNNMSGFSSNIWEIPADHYLYPTADGKKLYWFIRSVRDVASIGSADADHNDVVCKPMNGIDYGSINLETGEMSDFNTFGKDQKDSYYLFSNTAGYQMDNYFYFFSETKKGGKMLISRVDISK